MSQLKHTPGSDLPVGTHYLSNGVYVRNSGFQVEVYRMVGAVNCMPVELNPAALIALAGLTRRWGLLPEEGSPGELERLRTENARLKAIVANAEKILRGA